jgi:hypothetical protein
MSRNIYESAAELAELDCALQQAYDQALQYGIMPPRTARQLQTGQFVDLPGPSAAALPKTVAERIPGRYP